MNTSNEIWVPSYYRRAHPLLWMRGATGPRHIDWITGVMLAVLVLGLVAHARFQHHGSSAVVIATPATTEIQLPTDDPSLGGAPSMR
jgi:hypothetical protein